jgi:hypothetical protein
LPLEIAWLTEVSRRVVRGSAFEGISLGVKSIAMSS